MPAHGVMCHAIALLISQSGMLVCSALCHIRHLTRHTAAGRKGLIQIHTYINVTVVTDVRARARARAHKGFPVTFVTFDTALI